MARKMKTMDGNNAAAHVSYAFTEVAGIYPITPSSPMAELTDEWAATGLKNIFGQEVKVIEMQSEAGAAGTVHGSLAAGALTTTYTASQGLLLMIPNMYKIAGELLPSVIHVSARALAAHALSIYGDHSDVMACRQTGYAMLCSNNPQEIMDLGAAAHLSAIKGRVPFLHFFDGFRTSSEIQKIEQWDYADLAEMIDFEAIEKFRTNSLNPEHPVLRGTSQTPDIFFQAKEASNVYYNNLPGVVEEYLNKINTKIGTDYKLFNYYGAPDADRVIIAMGSVCDTIEETIDYLNARGEKVGLLKVRLYRPFSIKHFIDEIPATVKKIAVLDRTKEPGAVGEPLWLDVVVSLKNDPKFWNTPVVGGRYGLGQKDTTPAQIISVYEYLKKDFLQTGFTIGIDDDVTNLSLSIGENPDTTPAGTISCKFWGIGGDGTVGANKDSIKIIGDHTDKKVQAYFAYDAKKSGGLSISHLRFGDKPIRSTYYVSKADFVACHNIAYINRFDMTSDLKEGGAFLLNTSWTFDELNARLPAKIKNDLANKKAKFYTIDGVAIARELGLRQYFSMVLQSSFFKLANIIPIDDAVKYMKDAVVKTFGRKGEDIVKMNQDAIDRGIESLVEIKIPADWADAKDVSATDCQCDKNLSKLDKFVKNILTPVNAQKGDSLPVSTFLEDADGTFPQGSAAYEKRGIAVDTPEWIPENCIQCNFCSYVCPHAVIRPITLKDGDDAPTDMKLTAMTGMPGYRFGMALSVLDCTGCASCASICPGKKGEKALKMKPLGTQIAQQEIFNETAYKHADDKEVIAKFKTSTVKGSQFLQPLLEFSGACPGCGETPYAKLITQLFGDRMFIANATGCSSIWGGSAPATPYTTNKFGRGPAWANSLFEDNAEYGFGMASAVRHRREKLAGIIGKFAGCGYDVIDEPATNWLAAMNEGEASKAASIELENALIKANEECGTCGCEFDALYKQALAMKDLFVKKSVWIFGGDGWAYDIGFGGLDHVIASGEDVNIMVFDTEVYSNTGGQASKATPTGSIAQFAYSGKNNKKKDLASIAMSYGYVYVAQIAMGADYNQTLKAITEAENYKGPSLVIGYAPCINHGIKGGLTGAMAATKNAVAAGYWFNFRFNPEAEKRFTLDSKAPSESYNDFIMNETRYNSLLRSFPDRAKRLFEEAQAQAKVKYEQLAKLEESQTF